MKLIIENPVPMFTRRFAPRRLSKMEFMSSVALGQILAQRDVSMGQMQAGFITFSQVWPWV
jgi:hypothetical protein